MKPWSFDKRFPQVRLCSWSNYLRIGSLLLFLSLGLTARAASIPGGREAWCNLLKLPTLHYEWDLNWDFLDGFTQSTDTPDPAIEIPKLKARLQGRPADAAVYWDIWRVYVRVEDEVQASNALTRVVALYRQWAEVERENPEVLARFGLALSADRAAQSGPGRAKGLARLERARKMACGSSLERLR